jgi:hypothetical protein
VRTAYLSLFRALLSSIIRALDLQRARVKAKIGESLVLRVLEAQEDVKLVLASSRTVASLMDAFAAGPFNQLFPVLYLTMRSSTSI